MVEWRSIPSYPKYEASTDGRIRHVSKDRPLAPNPDANGYKMVSVSNEYGMKRLMVHRLIAQTFLPNPDGLTIVGHRDRDRTNNAVSNLEWTSHQRVNERNALTAKRSRSPATYANEAVLAVRRVCVGDLPDYKKFSNYFVTETGLILCQKAKGKFRILRSPHNGDGYQTLKLNHPDGWCQVKVHRLVALAFCHGQSEVRSWVNHLDHDRSNNHYSNLVWSTPRDNRNHGSHVMAASEAIRQDLLEGKTHRQIAAERGVCTGTVSRQARSKGLRRDPALPEELRAAILADLRAEKTLTETANKYGVGTTTICLLAKKHGVKPRGRRLPSAVRASIEVLLRDGVSQAQAARLHGVDRGTVSIIARDLQSSLAELLAA